MKPEDVESRLARLEQAMHSVKEDTRYLRDSFDNFRTQYWGELAKAAGKVGYLSAIVSLIVGAVTVTIAHAIWK